jgi:hypothetical protein
MLYAIFNNISVMDCQFYWWEKTVYPKINDILPYMSGKSTGTDQYTSSISFAVYFWKCQAKHNCYAWHSEKIIWVENLVDRKNVGCGLLESSSEIHTMSSKTELFSWHLNENFSLSDMEWKFGKWERLLAWLATGR